MPRKKLKPKTRRNKRAINVRKKRPKRSMSFASVDAFLDKTITVRTLLKYTSIVLLFLLVVGSAFMLGRISTKDNSSGTTELSSVSKKDTLPEVQAAELEEKDLEVKEDTENEEIPVEYRVADEEDDIEPIKEQYFEAESDPEPESVDYRDAEFGFEYSQVEILVSEIEKEERGTNWASVESLRLTIKNNEDFTIINPTRIKLKINPKGRGSNWWDDEVFLPESFKGLKPGGSISEVVDVHVSFSDIYDEKDFQLVVLDDYDVPIAWYKKIMVIK